MNKMNRYAELNFLLYKWKHNIITPKEKFELIEKLEKDAIKREKRDRWGAMIEYCLLYKLRGKSVK
jgi:hypothetical protein